mmetsp:Transcript_15814/g.20773  ORF Transcript_15814/g.20773 Transcript_15814/m.20773 type:complete len:232 (+) Transcript_15814:190-885(+)
MHLTGTTKVSEAKQYVEEIKMATETQDLLRNKISLLLNERNSIQGQQLKWKTEISKLQQCIRDDRKKLQNKTEHDASQITEIQKSKDEHGDLESRLRAKTAGILKILGTPIIKNSSKVSSRATEFARLKSRLTKPSSSVLKPLCSFLDIKNNESADEPEASTEDYAIRSLSSKESNELTLLRLVKELTETWESTRKQNVAKERKLQQTLREDSKKRHQLQERLKNNAPLNQ